MLKSVMNFDKAAGSFSPTGRCRQRVAGPGYRHIGLILLTAISLPYLRAADDAAKTKEESKPAPAGAQEKAAALVISGRVIDAETKEPIKKFDAVPGFRDENKRGMLGFFTGQRLTSTDGTFRFKPTEIQATFVVTIEADGYHAALSRDIKRNEGSVSIDFELNPIKTCVAQVVTPDLKPAANARVALGAGRSTITIENGEIRDSEPSALGFKLEIMRALAPGIVRVSADASGKFSFPCPDKDFQLVITHPSGYVQLLASPDWNEVKTIRLQPWARVEGTFRVGGVLRINVPIVIAFEPPLSFSYDERRLLTKCSTKTGKDGKFLFEHVIPGRGRVGRSIQPTPDEGTFEPTSSGMVFARFQSGKTAHVDVGAMGRPVIGKLQPPEGQGIEIKWNLATVVAVWNPLRIPRLNPPPIPAEDLADRAKKAAWWHQWQGSEEGIAWRTAHAGYEDAINANPFFTASVKADGTFRIDDMPEGTYTLSAQYGDDRTMFPGRLQVVVPPMDGGRSDEPLDLGVLTLRGK